MNLMIDKCSICNKHLSDFVIYYRKKLYHLECFAVASRTEPKLIDISRQFWGYLESYKGATRWECDMCGRYGKVNHDLHADVWSVSQQILEAHNKYDRPGGLNTIIVRLIR